MYTDNANVRVFDMTLPPQAGEDDLRQQIADLRHSVEDLTVAVLGMAMRLPRVTP